MMSPLTSALCVLALCALAGCGGAADKAVTTTAATTAAAAAGSCGAGAPVPAGAQGGKNGGTAYAAVPGSPIVSAAGGGTSCDRLLALAKEYAAGHVGRPFFQWLAAHGWTWLNADESSFARAAFDTDTYDVFLGTAPGERSQVAFRAG